MFDNLVLSYRSSFEWRDSLPVRAAAKKLLGTIPPYWRYKTYTELWHPGTKHPYCGHPTIRIDLTKIKQFGQFIYTHPEWHHSMRADMEDRDPTLPWRMVKKWYPHMLIQAIPRHCLRKFKSSQNYRYLFNDNARFQDFVDYECCQNDPGLYIEFNGWPLHSLRYISDITQDHVLDFELSTTLPELRLFLRSLYRRFCIRQTVWPLSDKFYEDQN